MCVGRGCIPIQVLSKMKNPVTLMVTLVSVQFVLYTISLCAPQWLVYTEGIIQGLFVLCNAYEGFSSCVTVSAWMGEHSSHCRHICAVHIQ